MLHTEHLCDNKLRDGTPLKDEDVKTLQNDMDSIVKMKHGRKDYTTPSPIKDNLLTDAENTQILFNYRRDRLNKQFDVNYYNRREEKEIYENFMVSEIYPTPKEMMVEVIWYEIEDQARIRDISLLTKEKVLTEEQIFVGKSKTQHPLFLFLKQV